MWSTGNGGRRAEGGGASKAVTVEPGHNESLKSSAEFRYSQVLLYCHTRTSYLGATVGMRVNHRVRVHGRASDSPDTGDSVQ